MKSLRNILSLLLIGLCCGLCIFPSVAADPGGQVPPVIDQGFQLWAKRANASYALDVWRKGGLLEDDRKPNVLGGYFSRIDRAVGNYKSYELISAKPINRTSEIIYVAINFERAAVYARFLMFNTDKGWVVQNMDFSTKPEAIMPWLAFEEVNYAQ